MSKITESIKTTRPITIDRHTPETGIRFEGWCRQDAHASITDTVIRIRRAGNPTHLIEYPADRASDGIVYFVWDSLFYELPPGRYIGDCYDGDLHVGFQQFELSPQHFTTVQPVDKENAGYDWGCNDCCIEIAVE